MKRIAFLGLSVFLIFSAGYAQFDFQYKLKKNAIQMKLMDSILEKLNKKNVIANRLEQKGKNDNLINNALFHLEFKLPEENIEIGKLRKASEFDIHENEFLKELNSENNLRLDIFNLKRSDIEIIKDNIQKRKSKFEEEFNKEKLKQKKPDVLKAGFLELFSDGTARGAAQVFKIRIGEPSLYRYKRFNIPLYCYLGGSRKHIDM